MTDRKVGNRMNSGGKIVGSPIKLALAAKSLALLASLAVGLFATEAKAEFPAKPITLVLGSTPGSAPDTLGRIVAEGMADLLGQPVVVENRQGANGSIAATQVANADADGYTLMLMTAVHSITPTTRKDLEYDFENDFRGVGMIASVPLLFVVNNELGTSDMASFVERAKAGDIFYSVPGIGSIQQLATEEFSRRAGIQMSVVPYRGGGNATKAVIANEVQLFFAGIPPALPHVKSGALTALAISTPERSPAAPDVPTMVELGYDDLVADNWHALYVRSDTPDEVVATLSAALVDVLGRPDTAEKFLNVGATPWINTPDEQTGFGLREVERWRNVIAEAGLTFD
jgi:tripartite-type tricarboxylate transporter receptor subunit TctC